MKLGAPARAASTTGTVEAGAKRRERELGLSGKRCGRSILKQHLLKPREAPFLLGLQ